MEISKIILKFKTILIILMNTDTYIPYHSWRGMINTLFAGCYGKLMSLFGWMVLEGIINQSTYIKTLSNYHTGILRPLCQIHKRFRPHLFLKCTVIFFSKYTHSFLHRTKPKPLLFKCRNTCRNTRKTCSRTMNRIGIERRHKLKVIRTPEFPQIDLVLWCLID